MMRRIWLALVVVLCPAFYRGRGALGQSVINVDPNASGGDECGSLAQPCSTVYEADQRASEIFTSTSELSVVKLAHGTYVIPHDITVGGCVAVDFEDGELDDCLNGNETVCGTTTASQVYFDVQLQANASDVTLTSIAVQLAGNISGSIVGEVWTVANGETYQTASFPGDWILVTTFTVSDNDSDTEFVIPDDLDTTVEYRGFSIVIPTGEEVFVVQDGSLGCGSLNVCTETLTDPEDDERERIQLSVAESSTANRFLGTVCYESIPTSEENLLTQYIPNDGGYFRLEGDPLNPELVIIQVDTSNDDVNDNISWEEGDAYSIDGITFQGVRDFKFEDANVSISNCIIQDGRAESSNGRQRIFEVDNAPEFTAHNLKFSELESLTAIDLWRAGNAVLTNIEISDSRTCEYVSLLFRQVDNLELTDVTVTRSTVIRDSCFNNARSGGAIFVWQVPNLTMTNVYVGNVEGIIGAALSLTDTSATVENFTAEHCVAFNEGIVHIRNSLRNSNLVTMRNSIIAHNKAVFAGSGLVFDHGALGASRFFGESLTIINNSVTDRTDGSGGAVVVRGEHWSVDFTNLTIEHNSAEFGGAVFTSGDVDSSTSVTFRGTRFEHNRAADSGGCAFIGGNGNVSFTSLVISGSNSSRAGGAFYMPQTFSGYVTLDDVKVVNSETIETGGALCIDGGHVVLKDTLISYATAGNGGGIYVGANGQIEATNLVVENCIVEGEGPCIGTYGYGGGIAIADVRERDLNAEELECATEKIDFTNVQFINNVAQVSGGAYHLSQDPEISSEEWERCSDEATWCSSCVMEANSAAFGDKRSAPFAYFAAPRGGPRTVQLGREFQLEALPYDGFDAHMDGDHAIIMANLRDPNGGNRAGVFLCGSLSANALSGSVSFAGLHVFLTLADGPPGSIAHDANRGVNRRFALKVEGAAAERDPNVLPMEIEGCQRQHELDSVREEDVPLSCSVNADGSQRTVPLLYACYPKVHLATGGRQAVLSLMGVIYAAGFIPIAMAFVLRNNRVVWSSSVKMLTMSAVGFFAVVASAFLRAIPARDTSHCMWQTWLFIVGRDFLVGAVLAKNWRVWKIFSLKSLQVLKISDGKLVLAVILVSLPSIITLTVQSVIDPLTVDPGRLNSTCTSATASKFVIAHAVWSISWFLGGLWIAYLARNIPAKFNEWKTVITLISTMAVVNIMVLAVAPQFEPQTETIVAVITVCIGFTLSMCVILTPKLYLIYKRRDGTLLSNTFSSKSAVATFDEGHGGVGGGKASSSVVPLSTGSDGETPVFLFKERYNRLRAELQRTQKLYERSYENTQELQDRYRMVESDLVALQYEREYRANVAHEEISNISREQEAEESHHQAKSAMRSRKKNARGGNGK